MHPKPLPSTLITSVGVTATAPGGGVHPPRGSASRRPSSAASCVRRPASRAILRSVSRPALIPPVSERKRCASSAEPSAATASAARRRAPRVAFGSPRLPPPAVFVRTACSSPQSRRTASLPVTFPGAYG